MMDIEGRKNLLALLGIVVMLTSVGTAAEPVVEVRANPSHFVGIPSMVQVLVEGLDEDPQPVLGQPDATPGLSVQLVGVVPQMTRSIQIINGRRSEYRSVIYDFRLRVVAGEAGLHTVGPFYIKQGQTKVAHSAIDLKFQEITEDEDVRVVIKLPDRTVYPGERVPVEIEWWYAGDAGKIHHVAVRSQLFDQFKFIDEELQRGDQVLPIETAEGALQLKASVTKSEFAGRSYVVVAALRHLIPDKPGEFTFPPAVATREKVLTTRRDFFGDRIPGATVPTRSIGEPLQLQVLPYPSAGRPDSFAGAVGSGFSMEVSADRTVVRVGDPIALHIRLRGDGNLENVSLPPLDVEGGMSREQFRLPPGELAGTLEDGVKAFQLSVRVLDANVREIPALAFSWFDTQTGTYRTTRSAPIALRVEEAEMITATDVVSRNDTTDADSGSATAAVEGVAGQPVAEATRAASASTPAHHADLSIEVNSERILARQRLAISETLAQGACYLGGLALISLAVWDRQRRQVDPEIAERRKVLREHQRRIQSLSGLASEDAAKQIADSLRVVAAGATAEDRSQIEPLIAQCEELIYVPQGGNGEFVPPELVTQAARIAGEILQKT